MPQELSLPEQLVALTGIHLSGLAAYIQVNPSTLSRFISNTRTLPAPALIQMAELLTTVNGLPVPEPQPLSAEEQSELQKIAANCHIKREKLEMQLADMQRKYAQGQRMLQLLPSLEAKPENASEKRQRWLAEQRYRAEERMAANGLVQQKILTVSINLLKQEAAAYLAI